MASRQDVQLDSTTTGVHKTGKIRDVVTEWNPKEPAAQEFRDMVLRELNALKNKTPDFDSGYIYVEAGANKYRIDHAELGGIPNQMQVFFSEEPEPSGADVVTIIPSIVFTDTSGSNVKSGVHITHASDGSYTLISTSRDTLMMHSYTEGYIRLLLWR